MQREKNRQYATDWRQNGHNGKRPEADLKISTVPSIPQLSKKLAVFLRKAGEARRVREYSMTESGL